MKPYKLIIFDWDGTLMDSQAKIVSCMQGAAISTNMPVPTSDEIKHIIGISLKIAIADLFSLNCKKATDNAQADLIVAAYKHIYLEQDQTPCPLFTGVLSLLDALIDLKKPLAVATGKARRGLQRAWDNTDTGRYFIDSRCADEAESKPSSDMLEQLLAANGCTPYEALMIGDTSYDMQMAENIGMDRIAVSYGVHDEPTLMNHKPIYLADSVPLLHDYLMSLLITK